MKLHNTLRHDMNGLITTALTTTSRLKVYTGSEPSKTASPTGTLLATFTLASTPGTDTGGVYTFTNPSNVTGAADGTPGYFRMIDGTTDDGTHTQIQGTCGVGSGELNFASTIVTGGTVSITSMTITNGNS
jgi:hypothetical protein